MLELSAFYEQKLLLLASNLLLAVLGHRGDFKVNLEREMQPLKFNETTQGLTKPTGEYSQLSQLLGRSYHI